MITRTTELFAVTKSEWAAVYEGETSAYWTTVENEPVFPIPTPCSSIYFSRWTLSVAWTVQNTLDNVSRTEQVIVEAQMLISVARWGTYIGDFRLTTDLGRGTEQNP